MLLDHGGFARESGALWEAASWGNIVAAKVLVERGVNVNEILVRLRQYKTTEREKEEVKREREEGNMLWSYYDGTPLHVAVEWNQPEMVEFLLNNGANKDLKNPDGQTALQIASRSRDGDYSPYPHEYKEYALIYTEEAREHRREIIKMLEGKL